jgi:circadian clock protein KaiC
MNRLPKLKTGIQGLDELTDGGLPKGRTTLLCGGAGCGKTLMAMEFLVHGARNDGEPGVFMAFEETGQDLTENMASLGFDLQALVSDRKLVLDFVLVDRSELEQSGEYNLEGLFIRLGHAIDSIGAKRLVLDTLETLFSALPNPAILRVELRRLFRWLKARGVTTVITGERGSDPSALSRQGLEEYVSDCVIVLDHRVTDMVSSRRLRVVKYRGSTHGTNEYPFLISAEGISLLPVTSLGLEHSVSHERVPSGVPGMDAMLGAEGFYRGSSVLISGTAGTGKSSMAAHFASAACARGERVLYFAFEESASQIVRNMASIGLDLGLAVAQGQLKFHASRPTLAGLEMHLLVMLKEIAAYKPNVVVIDPLNSFVTVGNEADVKLMLLRLVDTLKYQQITGFFTSLTAGGDNLEKTDVAISSLIDTWVLVRDLENAGERNRGLYILKSRGMAHSNQIREFVLTSRGVVLREAYLGANGMLTGSARLAQEAAEEGLRLRRTQETGRKQSELEAKRVAFEAQIESMRAEFAAFEVAAQVQIDQALAIEHVLEQDRLDMGFSRSVTRP